MSGIMIFIVEMVGILAISIAVSKVLIAVILWIKAVDDTVKGAQEIDRKITDIQIKAIDLQRRINEIR